MMRLPFSTTNDESAMDSASIVTGPALPGVGVPALAGTGVGVLAETCVRTTLSTRAAAPALRRPTSLIVSPEFSATLAIVKLVPTVPSGYVYVLRSVDPLRPRASAVHRILP